MARKIFDKTIAKLAEQAHRAALREQRRINPKVTHPASVEFDVRLGKSGAYSAGYGRGQLDREFFSKKPSKTVPPYQTEYEKEAYRRGYEDGWKGRRYPRGM